MEKPIKHAMLFIGKPDDQFSKKAFFFAKSLFPTAVDLSKFSIEEIQNYTADWNGDIIISYLAKVILPAPILKKAQRCAINFHPAPPEYRGVGGANFAIYRQEKKFGVTAHHMKPVVDSGQIIEVCRFPISHLDNLESLLEKSYVHQFALFKKIMLVLEKGVKLPSSNEQWTSHLITRRELNNLGTIRLGQSIEEATQRIKATTFPGWMPKLVIGQDEYDLVKRPNEGGKK